MGLIFYWLLVSYVPNSFGVEAEDKGRFTCKPDRKLLACLPKEYSKYDFPLNREIQISIEISEVININDIEFSITFAGYLNIQWQENRLRLSSDFGRKQAGPGVNATMNPETYVPISLEIAKELWLPDIFIYNLKTYRVIKVLDRLAGLWISADKHVLYGQATHITFICPMRFDKYPMDSQICKFQIGSYSNNDKIMKFVTENTGYVSATGNSLVLDYEIEINELKPKDTYETYETLGNFSLAGFEMVMHRHISGYIITYYLPSGLFVIVSWISFLIPMDVIPGRMTLLVTLFLVLVNIFNAITSNMPKAEGLTAIEVWMLTCILFVFGALIEYAYILFEKRMLNRIVSLHLFALLPKQSEEVAMKQLKEKYWRIDNFFLIFFPVLFSIFNIIYWTSFTLNSQLVSEIFKTLFPLFSN